MQKPKFRTVDKSAWVFVTTQLHKPAKKTMNRRTAIRCGYLATAANRLGADDAKRLVTPTTGESMSDFIARAKASAQG